MKNDWADIEGWASLGGRACYYEDLETAKRELVETSRGSQSATLGDHPDAGNAVSALL